MRIEGLLLHGFGKFRGAELAFRPGFNVIFGPNEAGKSTLQRFIQGMLYGFWKPGARRRTPAEELERFLPWQGSGYRGVLTYRLDATGQGIRVERDFGPAPRVRVTDADTGAALSFPQDERRELLFAREHTGLGEAEFLRTACVGQLQVRISGDADLAHRLHNLRDTGQEALSVRRVLDRLESCRKEVMQRLRPHREELDRLEEELARLARDREEALAGAARLRTLEAELQAGREALAALRLRQEALQWRAAAAALGELEELEARLAELAPWAGFPVDLQEEAHRLAGAVDAHREEAGRARAELRVAVDRHRAAAQALVPVADCALLPPDASPQAGILLTRWQDAQTERARKRAPLGARRAELAEREARLAALQALGNPREVQGRLLELDRTLTRAGARDPDAWLGAVRGALTAARRRAAAALPLGALAAVVGLAGAGLAWQVHPVYAALLAVALGLGALAAVAAAARPRVANLTRELAAAEGAAATWAELRRLLRTGNRAEAGECVHAWLRLEEEVADRRQRLAADEQELAVYAERAAAAEGALNRLMAPVAALLPAGGSLEARVHAFHDLLQRHAALQQSTRMAAAAAQAAQRHLERQEQDLADATRREAELLAGAGAADRTAFAAGCAAAREYEKLAERRDAVAGELAALLGDGGRAAWAAALADWQGRAEAAPAAEDPPAAGEDAAALAGRVQDLEREVAHLQGGLARAFAGAATLADLEVRAAALRVAVAELEDEKAALEMARDHITRAAEAMHREFAPQLNARLTEVLPRLTHGRYSGVAVDEHLSLQVEVPGTGRRVAASHLSAGTQDQLYLALRVALLELLVPPGKERPPLLLDDPFVQCDDARLIGCMDLMAELARSYQVLLFTCHRRELEFARAAAGSVHTIAL